MPSFDELIATVGFGEDGVAVYPDDFVSNLSSAYAADMEIPAARISVLEADVAAITQENLLLKARNYELLEAVPKPDSGDGSDDSSDDSDSSDSEDEDLTTEDLFGEKE